MALALPKLRWLLIGAVAAGVWVVREDMKGPRPPENVRPKAERSAEAKPRPPRQVAAKPETPKPPALKAAISRNPTERPVPPKPVAAKPAQTRPAQTRPAQTKPAQKQATALALPRTVERPPLKPGQETTGSVSRPDKPTFVQTRARVRLRAQARTDAAVIATLEPRTVMREVTRSGNWRLLVGGGRKGWVRADYLTAATFLSQRPKLPVADVRGTATERRPKAALSE